MNDYFTHYSSKEEMIADLFISDNDWLNQLVREVKRDNTPFHDILIKLQNGSEYTIEIKEDEFYWYSRTGNIGLDYYSAFKFLEDNRDFWVSRNNYWINRHDLESFKRDIVVMKKGKLFTCDADFQLFVVMNNGEIAFSKLYSNRMLQSDEFIHYLESNYDLRVNKKIDYNLQDNWDSAAYFVNPSDACLANAEVNDVSDFYKI